MTTSTQNFNLGFIGNKATELQNLFAEYSKEANEYGYFLSFTNYTELKINEGVYVITNCFETEQDFKEILMSKLLNKL